MLPEPLAWVGADHFFVDFVHADGEALDGFVAREVFWGGVERRAHFYREFEGLEAAQRDEAAQREGDHRRAGEDGEGGGAGGRAGLLSEEGRFEAVVAVLVGERAEAAVFAQHGYDAHHRRFFVDGLEARGRAQRRYELALERAVGVAHDAAEGPAAREPRGRELPVAEVRGEYYDAFAAREGVFEVRGEYYDAFAAREGVFHVFRAFDADGHTVDERRVVLPREQLDAGPYHVLVGFGEYFFTLGFAFFGEAEHDVAARDVFADAEEFDERDERQREGLGPPAGAYARAMSGSASALARQPGRMLRAKAMKARTCMSVIFFLLSSFIRLPPFGVSVFCAAKARGLRCVCVRYLNFMRRKSFFPTLSCA